MCSGVALAGWVTLAAAGAGAAACTPGPSDDRPFVAWNSDFKGYKNWASISLDNPNAGGSTHVAGKRTIYINHEPPAGASQFPVGTIIVKETAADGKIFARAKVGGTYNDTGAVGWEWYELQTTRGVTIIGWEGKGPRSSESYGGDPNVGCNTCHKLAVDNDYVLTPALRLTLAVDAGTKINQSADAGAESGSDDASHQ
jgi:hypothetical protein